MRPSFFISGSERRVLPTKLRRLGEGPMGGGCSRNATAPLPEKYVVSSENGTQPAIDVQQHPISATAADAAQEASGTPFWKRGQSLRDAASRGDVSKLEALLGPKGQCGEPEVSLRASHPLPLS